MKKQRYLESVISQMLKKKMVFVGGPRQVGKTTLALNYLDKKTISSPGYLNWDRNSDKSLILRDELPLDEKTIVFDELHKYKHWRALIKGLYDKYHEDHRFLVTGSARIDHFRKGGDSLLGRYRYLRLHPFSLAELDRDCRSSDLRDLLTYGGFPEPLFAQNSAEHRLWLRERSHRIVDEDLRGVESIKEISLVHLLAEVLPTRVGSPLSIKSLQEDLDVSQPTIQRWVQTLSNLYFCFLISPFGGPRIRAVKKLQKMYMWDWSSVEDPGARFENLVASHLLKYCHWVEDTEGFHMELRYLRDTALREIDFVVLKEKKPLFAVECKTGDRTLSRHIPYFVERLNIPEYFQVHQGTKDFGSPKYGRVLPFTTFCKIKNIP
jgi:predicted AAA+ superfamily ATPase